MLCLMSKLFKAGHCLARRLSYSMIEYKLYKGQGGQLNFDLTKRSYQFNLHTFWEDHCELSIQGLIGSKNFTVFEEEEQAYFKDTELDSNLQQAITVDLKIPQYYTLQGKLYGNLVHHENLAKIKASSFVIEILGNNHVLKLISCEAETVKLLNPQGSIVVKQLTCETGEVKCRNFETAKLMASKHFSLIADKAQLRSLIMLGRDNPFCDIISKNTLLISSLSCHAKINAGNVSIDNIYAGQKQIKIKCQKIACKIMQGTGVIQLPTSAVAAHCVPAVQIGNQAQVLLCDDNRIVIKNKIDM